MNSEPRMIKLSMDNFYAAIETQLRAFKEIHNDENVVLSIEPFERDNYKEVLVYITPIKQENDTTVDNTVH